MLHMSVFSLDEGIDPVYKTQLADIYSRAEQLLDTLSGAQSQADSLESSARSMSRDQQSSEHCRLIEVVQYARIERDSLRTSLSYIEQVTESVQSSIDQLLMEADNLCDAIESSLDRFTVSTPNHSSEYYEGYDNDSGDDAAGGYCYGSSYYGY